MLQDIFYMQGAKHKTGWKWKAQIWRVPHYFKVKKVNLQLFLMSNSLLAMIVIGHYKADFSEYRLSPLFLVTIKHFLISLSQWHCLSSGFIVCLFVLILIKSSWNNTHLTLNNRLNFIFPPKLWQIFKQDCGMENFKWN